MKFVGRKADHLYNKSVKMKYKSYVVAQIKAPYNISVLHADDDCVSILILTVAHISPPQV